MEKKSLKEMLVEKLGNIVSEISAMPEDREPESDVRAKMVIRNDGHVFVQARLKSDGNRKLRIHIHPNGHYNLQNAEMLGTKKVMFKGDM